MAKRSKPTALVIGDLAQAEAVMAELAGLARSIGAAESEMNEAIDQAKAVALGTVAPLEARKKTLETALAVFGQLNKAEFFVKKRSVETAFGTIGFRKSTKLLTLPKVKLAQVLGKLKEFKFTEAIKTTEAVNKEAMEDWPQERLESVGLTRKSEDVFYIEIKAECLE
ncbi:MAG: host-nuclease inhibitor Gam family protein [Deltaproteobacteria bacterium]|nr:host-nuclease inhibitor Gam family protein [Deltaproteobacteria bacterium]